MSETQTYNPTPLGNPNAENVKPKYSDESKPKSMGKSSKKVSGKQAESRNGGEFLEKKSKQFSIIKS